MTAATEGLSRPGLLADVWEEAAGLLAALDDLLTALPRTYCARRAACCGLLPGMSLIEAERVWRALERMSPDRAATAWRRLFEYYFINPVRVPGCPFLSGAECLVYEDRPFGCRAYGLWSIGAYRRLAMDAANAQDKVRRAWRDLGVRLPREVVEHRPAYCRETHPVEGDGPTDRELHQTLADIRALADRLGTPARDFERRFGADLSFLTVSHRLGFEESLRAKVDVVREYLATGESPTLKEILAKRSSRP